MPPFLPPHPLHPSNPGGNSRQEFPAGICLKSRHSPAAPSRSETSQLFPPAAPSFPRPPSASPRMLREDKIPRMGYPCFPWLQREPLEAAAPELLIKSRRNPGNVDKFLRPLPSGSIRPGGAVPGQSQLHARIPRKNPEFRAGK